MKSLCVLLFALCAVGLAARDPLFVFVGEKISIEAVPPGEDPAEFGFKARYRNVQNVHGDLPLEVIEFEGSDEYYSPPRFAKHAHVLLYVFFKDGQYHHVKHLFAPVYRLANGQWAAPYDWPGYTHKFNVNTPIKPVPMEFPAAANRALTDVEVEHMKYYPEIYVPFSKIEHNQLIPIMGNPVEQIFALNKAGPLKSLGYFE
ncbi:MAG: hypothetical protein ABIP85_26175 [Chthoniobacteraceae bacterium]